MLNPGSDEQSSSPTIPRKSNPSEPIPASARGSAGAPRTSGWRIGHGRTSLTALGIDVPRLKVPRMPALAVPITAPESVLRPRVSVVPSSGPADGTGYTLASLKSRILMRPSRVSRMLEGFRSRCAMGAACAAANPVAICTAQSRVRRKLSLVAFRGSPSTNSVTISAFLNPKDVLRVSITLRRLSAHGFIGVLKSLPRRAEKFRSGSHSAPQIWGS